MGKLDRFFGRGFDVSKLKILVHLAISRLAVLKNQRQSRCQLARSDIVQILNLGHHDRALLRVEQVIKEQNMLDVFVMIEGYCHMVAERINLLKQEKVCPEELKEAISSMLYASTRCGEFPELIQMRAVFTSRFGKEFAARAIELRNNCGVNPKMIQKLSTRQPSLENRLKVLKEIAAENNIVLQIEDDSSDTTEDKFKKESEQPQSKPEVSENIGVKAREGSHRLSEEIESMERLSDSIKSRKKYKDVADAAEAAYKSAAYAAAAARAAVELSKFESYGPGDQSKPRNSSTIKDQSVEKRFEKSDSESEDDETYYKEDVGASVGLSSSTDEDAFKKTRVRSDITRERRRIKDDINFDESDDENRNRQGKVMLSKTLDSGLGLKPNFVIRKDAESENSDADTDESDNPEIYRSQKKFSLRSENGLKTDSGFEHSVVNSTKDVKLQNSQGVEGKRPISVRTRLRSRKP